MSRAQKNMGKLFVTGGDVLFHNIQLFVSNLIRLLLIGGATFLISFWILVAFASTDYQWHIYKKVCYAGWWKMVGMPNYTLDIVKPDGEFVDNVTSAAILKWVRETPELSAMVEHINYLMLLSFFATLFVICMMIYYYIKWGKDAQTDKFLRGQKIVLPAQLASMIDDPSPIRIANVPVPLSKLARNILVVGSMGSGKTVLIDQMIEDARKWGKKMVIYDKTGEFTEKFFRPGIDVILSPVDARCADWSIFADIRKITDAATVSRFFVPENKKSADPVWDNAARMLLEDIITIVQKTGGTMADVQKIVTQLPLVELNALLCKFGAPSVGTINPENARGSESVRLTLTASPSIRFFSFFNKKTAAFSVRDFVCRNDDACLFLTSSADYHETCKPFISAWIELSLLAAMSMKPTSNIRLMFVLDELASLSKLKALDVAFTEARKYGICSVVGIQNLSLMDEIYGDDMTKAFVANLQNKVVLRTEEESSARRLADTLGKEEVDEVNESKSFGIESNRDGVNLSGKRIERHLVTSTEITILPDMTGYVKLAGDLPIAKIAYQYKHRKNVAEAYIERDGLSLVQDAPAPLVEDYATVIATSDDLPSKQKQVEVPKPEDKEELAI